MSRGSRESEQQAVLRAACCVFGACFNIVRDVVFDALLSRPCAWLQVSYRGQSDTGHNQRQVTKVRTSTSEKAEIDIHRALKSR